MTIAGQRVDLEGGAWVPEPWAQSARDGLSSWWRGGGESRGPLGGDMFFDDGWESGTSRSLTARELLTGSAFRFASEEDGGGGQWTVWGRGAWSGFSGRDDGLTLDGEVMTGMVGADFGRDGWLGGLMLSHSEGSGTYSMEGSASIDGSRGEITSSVTGLYPYLSFDVSERLSVWGLLGHGQGSMSLTGEDSETLETDIDMTMGAAGARGELVSAERSGGFSLALKTDALFVRTTSEAVEGLVAAEADVSRMRLGLEGSRAFEIEGGGSLRPSFEAGLRHDGGDAETGFGVEVGGGLGYTDAASGLTADVSVHGLLAHEESGFEEWGASGSVRYDPAPSSELGASMGLSLSRGASGDGADELWRRTTMAGIEADDGHAPGGSLEAEVGYGFSVLDGRAVGTPRVGVSLSDIGESFRLGYGLGFGRSSELNVEGEFGEDARALRAGYSYRVGRSLELNIEAIRREAANDDAPEHGLVLRAGLRW